MKFFWQRPKPKFGPGQLVVIPRTEGRKQTGYMLIIERRWIKPNGEPEKQWVYDGPIFAVSGGELIFATSGSCFLEPGLTHVRGIDWR